MAGPPAGNKNASINGTRIDRRRLVIGDLPKELISVRREGRGYRRAMEAAVLDAKGEINITDAHLIDTASAATIHSGICRWLLRTKIGEMTPGDILACSGAIIKAKQARDTAIRALDLDAPPPPPWAVPFLPPPAVQDAAVGTPAATDDVAPAAGDGTPTAAC